MAMAHGHGYAGGGHYAGDYYGDYGDEGWDDNGGGGGAGEYYHHDQGADGDADASGGYGYGHGYGYGDGDGYGYADEQHSGQDPMSQSQSQGQGQGQMYHDHDQDYSGPSYNSQQQQQHQQYSGGGGGEGTGGGYDAYAYDYAQQGGGQQEQQTYGYDDHRNQLLDEDGDGEYMSMDDNGQGGYGMGMGIGGEVDEGVYYDDGDGDGGDDPIGQGDQQQDGGDQFHPDQQGAPAGGAHQFNEHVLGKEQVDGQLARSQVRGAPDGRPGPLHSGGAPAPGAAPARGGAPSAGGGGGGGFSIALKNNSQGSKILAYITGQALDHNNTLFILSSDGKTPIYPPNPSGPNTPFSQDCGIDLGPPGSTRSVSIPHIAGGRIWFAVDGELQFGLNPGPALQEPSITNPSDPNFHTNWGFCELTYSPQQLYANISYVDFVGIPIALELTTTSSGTQTVQGLAPGGLDQIAQGLEQQGAKDQQGWEKLVVKNGNTVLRVLSPNQGMVVNPGLFATYFDDTVDQVWSRFSQQQMTVDTQAAAGKVTGHVSGDSLVLGGVRISKPTTHDIVTCSTGPFATGSDPTANAIIPRIGAAFNRSTLLTNTEFPAAPDQYYKQDVTNHYSRIVHAANLDGKGYAFPYDDVQQTGGPDQSGEVHASDPKVLTVTVG